MTTDARDGSQIIAKTIVSQRDARSSRAQQSLGIRFELGPTPSTLDQWGWRGR
jgi:hypothetical protein